VRIPYGPFETLTSLLKNRFFGPQEQYSIDHFEPCLICIGSEYHANLVSSTKFIQNAAEIDVDAVASNGLVLCSAICEHVENAGIHSGDATLVLPPVSLDEPTMARIKEIADKVAKAWSIT
jgi:carbamoyl-phosphate synthase large subunit